MQKHLKIGKNDYDRLLVPILPWLRQKLLLTVRADMRARRCMVSVRNVSWILCTVSFVLFATLGMWIIRPESSSGNAHKPARDTDQPFVPPEQSPWLSQVRLRDVISAGEQLNSVTTPGHGVSSHITPTLGYMSARIYKASHELLFSYISSWECGSGQLVWQTLLLLWLCILIWCT